VDVGATAAQTVELAAAHVWAWEVETRPIYVSLDTIILIKFMKIE
jgi:hypothetical protein